MKRKAQVFMLPTEKASLLALNKGKLFLSGSKLDYIKDSHLGTQPQHLYVTTDKEIQEGDWMLHTQHNTLLRCEVGEARHFVGHLYLKKIVATTDPELFQTNMSMNAQGYDFFGNYIGLPKIPTDFIEAYVREQGKMSHVMLEYEKDRYHHGVVDCGDPDLWDSGYWDYKLKLRSNGTVIVHPVVETADEAFLRIEQEWANDPKGTMANVRRYIFDKAVEWAKKNKC